MFIPKSPAISRAARIASCFALAGVVSLFAAGCNDAQAGGLLGAGGGALLGQAIGHNTTSTLIGAGAGALTGYIIGNESDKERARYGAYDDCDDCHRHSHRRGCVSNYDY